MARNFVIFYTSREGSSIIIDGLSRHPDISVPVFEELDRHWIKKFYSNFVVHEEIEQTLRTNTFDHGDDWGFQRFVGCNKRGQDVKKIGFKWRPHGNLFKIRNVLKRNDVEVLLLYRRDFLELMCSLAISEDMKSELGRFHGQFQYSRMSEAEKVEFELRVNQVIRVNLMWFSLTSVKRALSALRLRLLAAFCSPGTPVKILEYEAFLDKPEQFYRDLLQHFDLSDVHVDQMMANTRLKKATRVPAKERVRNTWVFKYNPALWSAFLLYALATRSSKSGKADRAPRGAEQNR